MLLDVKGGGARGLYFQDRLKLLFVRLFQYNPNSLIGFSLFSYETFIFEEGKFAFYCSCTNRQSTRQRFGSYMPVFLNYIIDNSLSFC